jgi:hypothetical protein
VKSVVEEVGQWSTNTDWQNHYLNALDCAIAPEVGVPEMSDFYT